MSLYARLLVLNFYFRLIVLAFKSGIIFVYDFQCETSKDREDELAQIKELFA